MSQTVADGAWPAGAKQTEYVSVRAAIKAWLKERKIMYGRIDLFDDEPSPISKAFMSLASLLLFPISILNFVALPAGAIWLCVLGYWKLVVFAILAAFLAPKIVGLLTIPSFGLQTLAVKTIAEQRSLLRWFFCGLLFVGSYFYFAFVFGQLLRMRQYLHCSWPLLLEYGRSKQWQIPPIGAYRKTCAYYAGLQRWSP
jgi:hypothetical protein